MAKPPLQAAATTKTAGEKRFEAYYAQQHLVDDFPQLLEALRRPLPITFRIFDATRDGTCARLEAEAVKLGATRLPADNAWTFAGEARRELRAQGDKTRDGALRDFLVRGDRFRCLRRQEEVSMASVEALDPRPNDVVLDCCAAPGSKTTQLVERCEGGCVVAVEYDAKRARALVARSLHVCGGDRAARLVVCKGDATKLPSSQRFDRVLCDVPCSGDGALRKTGMRAYRRWRCADALALHDLQLRIALKGADLLKVGGRLVYSTCSLNPVENEAVVSRLLAARPDLVLVDHGLGKAWRARPGLATWRVLVDDHRGDGVAAASDAYAHLRPPSMDIGLRRCARLYPHDGDRGGFFLAAFVKKRFSLTTPRLRLRPFAAADAARLPALCGDLEVSRTCMHVPHPYGAEEARHFLDTVCGGWPGGAEPRQPGGSTLRDRIIEMKRGARPSLTLAVVKRDGDELIGCVSLDRDNFNETPRIGYWLGRAFWRRGYATEAARAIIAHGFDVLGLERVDGTHFLENPASGAVLRKLGFVAVDEPSPPQACAARGGGTLPTATLRLARPQSRPSADAHPLRLIDEDTWRRLVLELDVKAGLPFGNALFARSGGGARGAGAWLLDRTASIVLSRLLAAGVVVEGAGVKIVEKRGGGEAARQLGTDLFDGRLTYDGADALLRRGALGAKRVVDVDAPAWRALLKGGRIPLSDLPAEMMEMSPGTAVARHGGSSITLWRGAADAVTVMVRGDDLERLRRGLPADRPYLRYAVAVAAVAAIAVMRRR
jgi:16S rRNA C967 or C1407 C5-methylase (RsmB/RsmF family)